MQVEKVKHEVKTFFSSWWCPPDRCFRSLNHAYIYIYIIARKILCTFSSWRSHAQSDVEKRMVIHAKRRRMNASIYMESKVLRWFWCHDKFVCRLKKCQIKYNRVLLNHPWNLKVLVQWYWYLTMVPEHTQVLQHLRVSLCILYFLREWNSISRKDCKVKSQLLIFRCKTRKSFSDQFQWGKAWLEMLLGSFFLYFLSCLWWTGL